jgi:glycosyltransferase involved in cell wall biosynthesis
MVTTPAEIVLDVSAVHPVAGGGHTYAHMLSRHLPAAGIDPLLITRHSETEDSWDGRKTIAIVPDRRPARLLWEQTSMLDTVSRRVPSARVLHSIHYTMPERPRTAAIARVVTIHDLTFFTRPQDHSPAKRVFFQRAIKVAAARADHLICVSEATAEDLLRLVPVCVPVEIIPHGIDLAHFATTEPYLGHDDAILHEFGLANPYVLHLGTIEPRKNVARLLDAVARLRSDGVADPDVVLVGGAWPGERERLPTPVGLRVHHLGPVRADAVPALLRRSAVVAYPSLAEGFGLPVIEALATGAPVVTSTGSVMERMALRGVVAVDPNNSVSIAAGIATALSGHGPTSTERIAVAQAFDVRLCAARHADLYRRFL